MVGGERTAEPGAGLRPLASHRPVTDAERRRDLDLGKARKEPRLDDSSLGVAQLGELLERLVDAQNEIDLVAVGARSGSSSPDRGLSPPRLRARRRRA